MNYKGYFKSFDGNQYSVRIITDSSDTSYTEIALAADEPFVLDYNTSSTPFEGIRTATATINIVNDDYMEDIFSQYSNGTKVQLVNETAMGAVIWTGYLQNNLQNQSFEKCYETISLNASDCLAISQYRRYKQESQYSGYKKQVVSFLSIIQYIMSQFPDIQGFYWTLTKKAESIYVTPDRLKISENNFYTTDTAKAWTLQEILDEMCKYLGFTCMQYGTYLYFIDYNYFTRNDTMPAYLYGRTSSTPTYLSTLGGIQEITQNSFRGSGQQINFNTIYNKIKVNCSFNDIDTIIPAIMDEDVLVPLYGAEYTTHPVMKCYEIPKYLDGDGKSTSEGTDTNTYYNKKWKNPNYDFVYIKDSAGTEYTSAEIAEFVDYYVTQYGKTTDSSTVTLYGWNVVFGIGTVRFYENGTDRVDFSFDSEHGLIMSVDGFTITPTKDGAWHKYQDFYYYVSGTNCGIIPANNYSWNYSVDEGGSATVTYDASIIVEEGSTLTAWADIMLINWEGDTEKEYDVTLTYDTYSAHTTAMVEAHSATTLQMQVNPFGAATSDVWGLNVNGRVIAFTSQDNSTPIFPKRTNPERNVPCSAIIDLATFTEEETQKGIPSSISFTKYLYVSQQGYPVSGATGSTDLETYHFPVLRLNNNSAPAVIMPDSTFITIDLEGLWERYQGFDYINPDWATVKSDGNSRGSVSTFEPYAVFKLGIGDYYWNGSSWTTTETSFKVPMDFGNDDDEIWNTECSTRNTVSWAEWTGTSGYKIPLNSNIDLNGDITFELRLPSALQISQHWSDYFNGGFWISDINVKIATTDQEKLDFADVVYENTIDENSINDLSDISLKITSYPGGGKLSYSNVGWNNGMLKGIAETAINGKIQLPEYNIIEKYYNQFSTKTKKEELVVNNTFVPYRAIKDTYWNDDTKFVILGQSKDFKMNKQTITIMEIKEQTGLVENTYIDAYWTNSVGHIASSGWGANLKETISYDLEPLHKTYVFDGSITSIPSNAFYETGTGSTLNKVILPATITSVASDAFQYCTLLNDITISATTAPSLGEDVFDVASTGTLTYPSGSDYNSWYRALPRAWNPNPYMIDFTLTGATVSPSAATGYTAAYTYDGSQSDLTASTNVGWITATVGSGSVSYGVGQNTSVSARTGTINLSDGTNYDNFVVTQSGLTKALTCTLTGGTFDGAGYKSFSGTTTYNGNTSELTISSSANWLTAEFSGNWTDGHRTLNVYADAATSTSDRTGRITLSDGEVSLTISFSQNGAYALNYKVYVGNDSSVTNPSSSAWTEISSYYDAGVDFLLPSGYTYVWLRLEVSAGNKELPNIVGYCYNGTGGKYATKIPDGVAYNGTKYYEMGFYNPNNSNLVNNMFFIIDDLLYGYPNPFNGFEMQFSGYISTGAEVLNNNICKISHSYNNGNN